MYINLMWSDGGFNMYLKCCYFEIFGKYLLVDI